MDDAERIERMVEDSKQVHKIVEFANGEGVEERMEALAEALLRIAIQFDDETDLSKQEIAAALGGSITGVLVGWATGFEDG